MQIIKGDCLSEMQKLPDGVADMVLTDPPYSSGGTFSTMRKASTKKKYTGHEYNGAASLPSFSGDNMDLRSYSFFMREIFMECRRLTKEGGVIATFIDFRNLPATTDALQMAGWIWRGVAVWDKIQCRPQMGRYRNQCEFVVWGSNGDMPTSTDRPPLPGLYQYMNVATQERQHQTEKPVQLMRDLMEIVPKGAVVLDPFMGSGSTGVACAQTGRDFIGIEQNDHYFTVAKTRIEQALPMLV